MKGSRGRRQASLESEGFSCLLQVKGCSCLSLQVLPPFCVLFLLAVLARWLGANQPLGKVGLGSTVWALLFGPSSAPR